MLLIIKEVIFKFIKFSIVGFSGLLIDFGFTALCKEVFKIKKYISNAIGFTIAATSNYILNRIWTFNSQNTKVLIEFTEFFIISIIGLSINTFIIWLLINKLHANFYLSKAVATIIVVLWNFLANLFVTFAN
ncbi:MAG TPA: GtrA family protein [Bacteroidales bacterium]|nr:GtrA family protein [Bacteroidales bacterium]